MTRDRRTPYDLRTIKGYPATLKLYRIDASSHWQVRFPVPRGYERASTKAISIPHAEQFAKEWFAKIKLAELSDFKRSPTKFAAVAEEYMIWRQTQVQLGIIKKKNLYEDKLKLQGDLIPFFGAKKVDAIDKRTIESYLASLADRKLSKSTLSKHISLIRRTLEYAAESNLVRSVPKIPSVGTGSKPRAYFDLASYQLLWRTAYKWARTSHVDQYVLAGKSLRKLRYDMDFFDFIVFSVNVFVRLSDVKLLQHRHISVVRDSGLVYLAIIPPDPKASDRESLSMMRAVNVYERLQRRHPAEGFANPNDYVFFPQYENRDYALSHIRRLFENLLKQIGLKTDGRSNVRTLYSLRHTALMFRFLYGDNIDIFDLARNALTSVEMLEKFYLSYAESRSKIASIQSFRKKKS